MTAPATVGGAEERAQIALSDAERALVNGSNDFAFRLMREANTDESRILSPLSIVCALGMVNNGAAGQTQAEINEVLGGSGATPEVINTFCQKMLSQAADLDPDTKVCMANNIYMNVGYELLAPFVKTAKTYYDATPEVRNFKDGKTMDVINQWASDHTEQMVKEVLNEQTFNDDAASYLLNALYFKGTWTIKFDRQQTVMERFNFGDEEPMMHMKATFGYDETDSYQAVRLPYGNEAFQMTIFLPRKDLTVADVLGLLEGSNWQLKGMPREVDLKLPRIETETSQDLKPVMRALGMPTAFDRDLAEFPYFCNLPTYIAEMRQRAKITLNEEGTEAAAVTTIEMVEKSAPATATFHATRPFVYVVSELSTGAIFFIGQYMGGTTAGIPTDEMTVTDRSTAEPQLYNMAGQRLNAPPARGIFIADGKKVIR
jgi:serpin B